MATAQEKAQLERRIFESIAPMAGLIVLPESIRQNDPPAPDIECLIQDLGPLAVELVALDAAATRTRLQNMNATGDAWNAALRKWPAIQQEQLRAKCADVFLVLIISNEAGTRKRTEMMKAIQEQLLAKPIAFVGELSECSGVTVIRGKDITNGPQFNAPSAGHWLMPQIAKIREKLTVKTYCTAAPLELFAYSMRDDVDGHVDSLNMIDECVKEHLPGSSFRRVRVFDLWTKDERYRFPT